MSSDGGGRTLGAPDKNDHKKFDSTFLGFLIGILIYCQQNTNIICVEDSLEA